MKKPLLLVAFALLSTPAHASARGDCLTANQLQGPGVPVALTPGTPLGQYQASMKAYRSKYDYKFLGMKLSIFDAELNDFNFSCKVWKDHMQDEKAIQTLATRRAHLADSITDANARLDDLTKQANALQKSMQDTVQKERALGVPDQKLVLLGCSVDLQNDLNTTIPKYRSQIPPPSATQCQ